MLIVEWSGFPRTYDSSSISRIASTNQPLSTSHNPSQSHNSHPQTRSSTNLPPSTSSTTSHHPSKNSKPTLRNLWSLFRSHPFTRNIHLLRPRNRYRNYFSNPPDPFTQTYPQSTRSTLHVSSPITSVPCQTGTNVSHS